MTAEADAFESPGKAEAAVPTPATPEALDRQVMFYDCPCLETKVCREL